MSLALQRAIDVTRRASLLFFFSLSLRSFSKRDRNQISIGDISIWESRFRITFYPASPKSWGCHGISKVRTEEKEEKEEEEEEEEKGNGSHCARDLASARVTLRVRLGVCGGGYSSYSALERRKRQERKEHTDPKAPTPLNRRDLFHNSLQVYRCIAAETEYGGRKREAAACS